MQYGRISSLRSLAASAWHETVARAVALCMTIRGRILVAFLIMSAITASLGVYAVFGIRHAGILVDKTFDESLMSINYARAAAADFAAMPFARQWIASEPTMRADLGNQIEKLSASLAEDLQMAAGRSQSDRATRAAENVQRAAEAWVDAALENMSQGLCLYDAQNRLEVFNRRFLEIFKLPP